MGYNDFGDFYYAQRALGDAFNNYVRTRDYCTTSKHIIYMCLNTFLVSIEMGHFTHVCFHTNVLHEIRRIVTRIIIKIYTYIFKDMVLL